MRIPNRCPRTPDHDMLRPGRGLPIDVARPVITVMQDTQQQFRQWIILAITIAIPLVVGVQALLRLQPPSDLISGVGNGVLVLLSALVLILLAAVFLGAWLCKRCRRNGTA